MPAPTSWLTFLHHFAPCFTAPGMLLFEQLVTAWALCPGRRTLTRLWSVMPAERRRRYGAYARWVREGKWSPDELWRRLVVQLVERWASEGLLTLLLDDTLVNKSGRKVDGAGYFHDAVTSTAVAHTVTAWGLNVVVLALRIPSPWGGEPPALPVMVCLHRKNKKGATEEEEELSLIELAAWMPTTRPGPTDLGTPPSARPRSPTPWPPFAARSGRQFWAMPLATPIYHKSPPRSSPYWPRPRDQRRESQSSLFRPALLRAVGYRRSQDAHRQRPGYAGRAVRQGGRGTVAEREVMTKFNVGDRVTVRDATSIFHTRTQSYVRGHTGVVVSDRPEWVIPEDEAWGREDGRKEPFYVVRFRQTDLWPHYPGSDVDTLETEASERWLVAAVEESK